MNLPHSVRDSLVVSFLIVLAITTMVVLTAWDNTLYEKREVCVQKYRVPCVIVRVKGTEKFVPVNIEGRK